MRFISPHRSILFAGVSGSVDANYAAAWLTDGLPGWPVKKTGDLSLTVAPSPALELDVIAVVNHNIREAASITLGGDLSSSIVTAAHPPDGIPHNWYRRLSAPASVDSLILGVTGNVDPVIIGELYAGLSMEFDVDFRHGRTFDPGEPFPWEGEAGAMAPYDNGVAQPRRLAGELALEDDEFAELIAWQQATRKGSRPSLVIPDDTKNDAWLCNVRFTESTVGATHFISMELVEIPRVRW